MTFAETLIALSNVKKACFGKIVDPRYKEIIKEFEEKWLDIYEDFDIYFTYKCHVIIDHIPQAIEKNGKGLFFTSEQVVEASHKKFGVYWERYKVLKIDSDSHGERLLSCVIDFNTSNI